MDPSEHKIIGPAGETIGAIGLGLTTTMIGNELAWQPFRPV